MTDKIHAKKENKNLKGHCATKNAVLGHGRLLLGVCQ
jgi:hypothetical protein